MKEKYRCRIHENNDKWETVEAYSAERAAEDFVAFNDDGNLGEWVEIEVKPVGRGKQPEVVRVYIRTEYSA